MQMITCNGMIVQAFPLFYGRTNVTSTDDPVTFTENDGIVRCVEDGTIEITWVDDETAEEFSMLEGQDYAFTGVESIAVTAGTFHFSK